MQILCLDSLGRESEVGPLSGPLYGNTKTYWSAFDYATQFLGANYAIVEDRYIDRDYRSSFAFAYARKLREHGTTCTRIHFFRVDGRELTETPKVSELLEAHYCGYLIRRPVQAGVVGRTALESPGGRYESFHGTAINVVVPCQSTFHPHLLDREMTVQSIVFAQQDGLVMSCAETVLWMMARHLSKRRLLQWLSPADIAMCAADALSSFGGRPLPSEGMHPIHVASTMNALGLNPVIINPKTGFRPIEFIVKHTSSGLPVAVAVNDHIMLAVGYVTGWPPLWRHVGAAGERDLRYPENHVLGIVVHDDASGPFRIICASPKARRILSESLLAPLLHDANLSESDFLAAPTPPRTFFSSEHLDGLLDVLITNREATQTELKSGAMLAANAIAEGCSIAHRYSAAAVGTLSGQSPLLYTASLLKGSEVRRRLERLDEDVGFPDAVMGALRNIELPRFVWYCEMTTEDLIGKDKTLVLGNVLVDSTEHHMVPAHLLLSVPGACLHRDVQSGEIAEHFYKQERLVERGPILG